MGQMTKMSQQKN